MSVSLDDQTERRSFVLYECVQWMCPKNFLPFVTSQLSENLRRVVNSTVNHMPQNSSPAI